MKGILGKAASSSLLFLLEAALFLLIIAFLLVEKGGLLLLMLLGLGTGLFFLAKTRKIKTFLGELLQGRRKTAVFGLMVLLLLFPVIMRSSPYWIFIITLVGLYIIVGLGLNLELGSAGMVNLAGAAFYGIGAYSSSLLALKAGWPAIFAIPLGAAAAAALGILLFLPIMKTRGHYLALVTLAFGLIVNLMLDNTEWTGGPQGLKNIPPLSLGPYDFTSSLPFPGFNLPFYSNYFYLVAVITGIAIFLSLRLYDSWVGLTWAGIRDDEIAAKCSGISPEKWKLVAFGIGNFLIGLAGAIYAHLVGFISPPNFTFGDSLIMLSIVILGGMDNVGGVVLGASLLVVIPEKLRVIQDYRFLFYGLAIIVMVIFRPQGLLPSRIRKYGLSHEPQ